jgi:hypothetical protein
MNTEIMTKVCHIVNDLKFDATEELLSEIDRIIDAHKEQTSLDKFIDEINEHFKEYSFSNSFMEHIFNLKQEEISFIFTCYFKYKKL